MSKKLDSPPWFIWLLVAGLLVLAMILPTVVTEWGKHSLPPPPTDRHYFNPNRR